MNEEKWNLHVYLEADGIQQKTYVFDEAPQIGETSTAITWSDGKLLVGVSTHELIYFVAEKVTA